MSTGFPNQDQHHLNSSTGSNSNSTADNQGPNYLGQLAAANQVQRLVQRYLSLAPVFIGGPANTSLEAPPPTSNSSNNTDPMTNQFSNVALQVCSTIQFVARSTQSGAKKCKQNHVVKGLNKTSGKLTHHFPLPASSTGWS